MSGLATVSDNQVADLAALSQEFESATPQQILRWALETYGDRVTMATAFGPEGCSIIAMLAQLRDEIGIVPDIFNLDTGYQFPQTLSLKSKIEKKYSLPIRLVSAPESVADMEKRFGGPIYGTNSDECCNIRKVVPLSDALAGFDAYITAVRRDQTPERAGIPIIGFDPRNNKVKISPLVNWTKEDVWNFIKANGVPTNLLHEQGYASIGCWPCTRPVKEGEDERSGRWQGTEKRECGLHLHSHTVASTSDSATKL
jgi:phosphoadenosine phosphosulfate reductase